jgi:anti-anti-sigma factor
MSLDIKLEKRDQGIVVVYLAGSLDSATYADFEQQLKPYIVPETRVLMCNLANLQYISSMGVSVILRARKLVQELHNTFMMTNLQPQIQRVFEIINALPLECVFQSVKEADKYLLEMQRKAIEEKGGGAH